MLSATEGKKILTGFPVLSRRLINDQRGVTTIEYALIGVAVAILILAAVGDKSIFKEKMVAAFDNIGTTIESATSDMTVSLNGDNGNNEG